MTTTIETMTVDEIALYCRNHAAEIKGRMFSLNPQAEQLYAAHLAYQVCKCAVNERWLREAHRKYIAAEHAALGGE